MDKKTPPVIWQPVADHLAETRIAGYMNWLREVRDLKFDDYDDLWSWSVDNIPEFWQSIWDYFQILHDGNIDFVVSEHSMPDTQWFGGVSLNYAEHIFRSAKDHQPAIIFHSERTEKVWTWKELREKVASLTAYFNKIGVKQGDCVVAYLPTIPEATVAFLAANAIGAIWSSCSPDFGPSSVIDRFKQIQPKVLIAADGYQYNGKSYDKRNTVHQIVDQLPSLEKVITIPYLNPNLVWNFDQSIGWKEATEEDDQPLQFTRVPFDHPIWVLYSSGTTGSPKAITHSHGGCLLEHLKYLHFHNDVKPGDRFFWYTTTGWMMWNYVQAALLAESTIVLYDGSPSYPDLNVLWEMAEKTRLNHFGTSAPYILACMKKGVRPSSVYDLAGLRSVSSTGSPLPPEAFTWIGEEVGDHIWPVSMSGGTDVCTAFIGGVPTLPVYEGEIQRRALGCSLQAFDVLGRPAVGEMGEMVITKPMPSMPIYFWNDPGKQRYQASYFEEYPGGIWRHGDWITITERNTIVVYGRSDATLNRHGIRIGTAEIYRSLEKIVSIKDSLIVNLELPGGRHYMPLFVVLQHGVTLDAALKDLINSVLKTDYTPRHVPDDIILIDDIPYTISGKKLEAPVKKILLGIPVEKAANLGALRNPESLVFFERFRLSIV